MNKELRDSLKKNHTELLLLAQDIVKQADMDECKDDVAYCIIKVYENLHKNIMTKTSYEVQSKVMEDNKKSLSNLTSMLTGGRGNN